MVRVRIFVDHSNVECSWERARTTRGSKLNWARLPTLLMDQITHMESLAGSQIDFRGISVYASTHPSPNDSQKKKSHWLQYVLDQMEGYTVKVSVRQAVEETCDQGHKSTHYVEKGVDTKISCDMLSLAMRDLYDIGIIISDDADLIPSIECVQDVLDKKIIHAGFKDPTNRTSGAKIRSAAWAHVFLAPSAIEVSTLAAT